MKIFSAKSKVGRRASSVEGQMRSAAGSRPSTLDPRRAFTMIEIAISLAIIGIALVGIIGVLPMGMNVQRDNREETIINQDAGVLLEAVRSGARGLDDLTNYVYAITNYWTEYNNKGGVIQTNVNGYTYNNATAYGASVPYMALTNGYNIIGILSTPEFTLDTPSGTPTFAPTNNLFSGGYSNHIVAYVRSMSGPAVEKPPQDNTLLQADSFGYRILCVNAPLAVDTNIFNPAVYTSGQPVYNQQLAANLHELRMTFLWPQQPNGSVGSGHQTFRALVAGQVMQAYDSGQPLYFYQSQSFTNVP
jgi:prepilin-type N-terminal cleavage/methylation domain-containing protein